MRQWLFASLIKFVSLTSQSITKCFHRRRKDGLCIYFEGNIFNIKLTIVAAQKLLYCQFSAQSHCFYRVIDIPFCARKGKRVTIPSWNTCIHLQLKEKYICLLTMKHSVMEQHSLCHRWSELLTFLRNVEKSKKVAVVYTAVWAAAWFTLNTVRSWTL